MEKKNKLLTIGQFAALHGINKKTLMWYDEIGLFRPTLVHPENGYRYYSYHQSAVLETILLLRELDVSIEEIRGFMEQRSAASLQRLLEEKMAELDQRISHLQGLRKTLAHHHRHTTALLTMDLSRLSVVEKPARHLVTVDIDSSTSFEKQVELIIAQTQKYQLRRLHDAAYGTMIPVEALARGDFDGYTKLFIEPPFPIPKRGLHVQPKGRYIRAFYRGPWDQLPEKYGEIFAFARAQGLEPEGYAYEVGINETVVDRIEDSIVQIEVPVGEGKAEA